MRLLRLQSLAPATLPLFLALFGEAAQAHPGHAGQLGFWIGLLHPLTGVDHVLAMLGVGVWSAFSASPQTRRIALRLPLAFVAAAALGTVLGMADVFGSNIEIAPAISLVPLGLALLLTLRREGATALCLVALCGLLHGGAHGRELAGAAGHAAVAGFLLGTALLHATGAALLSALSPARRRVALSGSGAGLAAAGLWLLAV